MIHVSSENAQRYERVKRKGVAFLSGIFRSKRFVLGMKIDEEDEMDRPRVETPGKYIFHAFFGMFWGLGV